jgi:hypothetical protein
MKAATGALGNPLFNYCPHEHAKQLNYCAIEKENGMRVMSYEKAHVLLFYFMCRVSESVGACLSLGADVYLFNQSP